jgi:fluoride exporter
METLSKFLLVGGGGFLGANLRYWLGSWMQGRFDGSFPWPTFIINVSGSVVIGLLMGLIEGLNWNPNWRLLGAVGILGGYTTYSTFAYEGMRLLAEREYTRALIYIEASALITVFGAWLGFIIAKLLITGRP